MNQGRDAHPADDGEPGAAVGADTARAPAGARELAGALSHASGWRERIARLVDHESLRAGAAHRSEETSPSGGASPPTPPTPLTQLGLQFELREMTPRTLDRWNGPTSRTAKPAQKPITGVYQLGARPVHRTARGWARGSLTWANIGHQGGRLSLDPDQQRWFREVHALYRAASTITVGQDPHWIFLDEYASPAIWVMLAQAEALGIALLSGARHKTVALYERGELFFDVTRTPAGGLGVRVNLTLDGAEVSSEGLSVVAAHGLYSASVDRPGDVWLAPVPEGVSEAAASLLASGTLPGALPGDLSGPLPGSESPGAENPGADTSGAENPGAGASGARTAVAAAPAVRESWGDILVPPAEQEAFLRDGVPALRSVMRIESTDGSVQIPEPSFETVITLTAAWRRGHRLRLSWDIAASETLAAGKKPAAPAGANKADHTGEPASPLTEYVPEELLRAEYIPHTWIDDAATLPAPVELTGPDAAEFLVRAVPQLEALDGVEVRISGDPPAYREATAAPVLTVTTVPSEKEDWFDLGVLVTVAGRTVPFTPLFKALAQGKKKLLLVDNSYLDLRHPALTPLAELITEGQDLDEWETGARLNRHQALHWAEFEDTAEDSAAASDWRALVREISEPVPTTVALPATVRATLRPYQREGYHWLAYLWRNRLGGILADDMGLGKTLQVLTLIAHAKELGEQRPFLVIAPTSVVSNWAAEAARFTPDLRVRVRSTTEAATGHTVQTDITEADIVVTSYALFRLDYEKYHAAADDPEQGVAGLILDEAQFVKNRRAQGNELAEQLPVAWKLALTGTPLENSLRELHAICQVVAPGLFPSERRFIEDYVRTIERPAPGNSVGKGAGSGPAAQARVKTERLARLRSRLKPFMLRRTKSQVAVDLPSKQEQVLEVMLAPDHRALYDAFLQRERQKLFGLITDLDRNRFTVFRSLTLLRMLTLDATLIDDQYGDIPSAKLDALAEHAQELASEGRRALVFSQFTSFLQRARTRLNEAGIRTLTLDGSTRNRDTVIQSFRAKDADVFLISLKAGGIGLNLTEADTVILLDPWWNPASEAQAIDRSHRIGQTQPVHVIRLIASGTIEEKVLDLQRRKRALFDAVIDDEDLFAQTFTAEDIHELLR